MLLTIKNKKYGLQWGMRAFEPLEDELQMSGVQIIDLIVRELATGRTKTINKLAFEAIKLWCSIKEEYCEISYQDFIDWLDKADDSSAEAKYIVESFQQSWFQGKQVETWIKEVVSIYEKMATESDNTVKKKATTKRASQSSKTATSGVSRAKRTTR